MLIHIVKEGETLSSISSQYGVSQELIRRINFIENTNNLVVGQAISILFPQMTHTVVAGETLEEIAGKYSTTIKRLLQNNPYISNFQIYPGQSLVISYKEENSSGKQITVNGYTYTDIDIDLLKRTLPYLTYLTVFSYGFTTAGEIIRPANERLMVDTAKEYSVKPVMLFSTLTNEGVFSNELGSALLNNPTLQDTILNECLKIMDELGYYGFDIDFEFISPADREAYIAFVSKATELMNSNGYITIVALAPKASTMQRGLLYESHDYKALGNAANFAFIMAYEWGYTYGPPMAVAPINQVRRVLDFAVTQISPQKILYGINIYGYDWPLPYQRGVTRARSISPQEAIEIAASNKASISYDELSQAPYFYYTATDGIQHVVWFEDAASAKAKLMLINEYGFEGCGFWNLKKFFPQMWLTLISLYSVK